MQLIGSRILHKFSVAKCEISCNLLDKEVCPPGYSIRLLVSFVPEEPNLPKMLFTSQVAIVRQRLFLI